MTEPKAELTPGQQAYKDLIALMPAVALWDADPDCDHEEVPQPGGGVRCKYCTGWFCF